MDDLVNIHFSINGHVTVDLLRAKEDPYWDHCAQGHDNLEGIIIEYIRGYLRKEDILKHNAPFTCGPAEIYSVDIEIDNTEEESINGKRKDSIAKVG